MLKDGIDELRQKQREDGGWAQLVNLESDAWATGLALLAMHTAGLDPSDSDYRRGMEFLLSTQFDDGSWFVRTRTRPVIQHFDSQFPHGKDQWISAAGTALACASLALALDPVKADVVIDDLPYQPSAQDRAAATGSGKPQDQFKFNGIRTVDFEKDIRPLFENSCLDCHGADRPKGGFKVVDRASLLRGGESGVPALILGRARDSQLIRHVADQVEDMEMPPLNKRKSYPAFTADEISKIRTWINEGAHWPEGVVLEE